MNDFMRDELGAPKIVDRSTFQAELDALRVREKAHTREGDATSMSAFDPQRSAKKKRERFPAAEITPSLQTLDEGRPENLIVNLENRLRDVETNCRDRLHG
jgi:hypothetical protein